jgi:hypothetical protein
MIDIGATDIYIGVPSMPREEFEEYSTRLFDEWEAYVEKTLQLPDYHLSLEVEEGSVKAHGKIVGTLAAVYFAIGNYGSFISGLQLIRDQFSAVSNFLVEQSVVPFDDKNVKPKVRKSGGSLARLQGLFGKVQRGDITIEQAMQQAEILFGDDATAAPEFMQDLQKSFEQVPLFPIQLPLDLEIAEEQIAMLAGDKTPKARPYLPLPSTPNMPLPQHFRVEIWRESKKGQRHVRVIKL